MTIFQVREYEQRLAKWVTEHQLTRSTRPTCLHGLTGRGLNTASNRDEHNRECRAYQLDHATLWNRGGRPAALLAHPYAPDVGDAGRGSFEARVDAYVAAFPGVTVWIGEAAHPLSVYRPGRNVPVLYGAPGVELRSLVHPWPERSEYAREPDWVIRQRRS